jgi:hypothetical protein
LYFFKDELKKCQDLCCPCFLSFFLNTVKKLLTLFSRFESIATALLKVLKTNFGLVFAYREFCIHVFIGLVPNVDSECSYDNHNDVIDDWHSVSSIEVLVFDWIVTCQPLCCSPNWHFIISQI